MKLTMDIIGSFIVATIIIFSLLNLTDWGVEYYFHDEAKWDARLEQKSDEVQKYITSNKLSLDEIKKLSKWCDDNKSIYLSIVDGDSDLFIRSSYGVSYSNLLETDLVFSDGTATMTMYYFVDYRYYYIIEIIDVVFGMIVFLVLVLHRIRRIVREINQLESDVRIFKTGGLEHEIKVNNDDELGSLQRSLDEMRIALAKNIKMQETLAKANNELVTRMSHDLRTPLTSLLLYLDLIGKRKYNDEAQLQKYVSVSKAKAEQIKDMSELLFERFLVTGDSENVVEQNAQARYALEDPLSGLVTTLEAHGFMTYTDINWPNATIRVIPKYVDRVLDNVYSNIIKYANRENPVVIGVSQLSETAVMVRISNHIGPRDSAEGSGIGLENIRIMMEKMGGSFVIKEDDRTFVAELTFKVVDFH